MNIRLKLILMSVALTVLIMVLIGSITLYSSDIALKKKTVDELEAVATIQKARVNDAIERNIERFTLVFNRPVFRATLSQGLAGDTNALASIQVSLAGSLSSIQDFNQITIVTTNQRVLVSTDTQENGTFFSDTNTFQNALNAVSLSSIYLDRNGNPFLQIYGPIWNGGQLIGVGIIEEKAGTITSITQDYTGLGKTGETFLVKKNQNGTATFVTQPRFQSAFTTSEMIPQDKISPTIRAAIERKDVTLEEVHDYRGESVLAAIRYIPDADWGLISKIDTKEAFEPIINLRNLLLIVDVIALLLIIGIVIVISDTISRPIIRLTKVARSISRGDLTAKIDPELKTLDDEVGALARSFDRTMVSLKLAMRRFPADKSKKEKKESREKPPVESE